MKKIKKIFLIFIILIFVKIIVYADDELLNDIFSYKEISISASAITSDEPHINAKHAIVFDRKSKKSIFRKMENEKCKMASTTKIMTAIVVLENSSLDDIVKISKKSARNRWLSFGVIHK